MIIPKGIEFGIISRISAWEYRIGRVTVFIATNGNTILCTEQIRVNPTKEGMGITNKVNIEDF